MLTLNDEHPRRTTVIRPPAGFFRFAPRELWEYRELAWFLAVRDIKVRYKQTALGAGWAILQPVGLVVVFTVFFGGLADIPSEGLPYPLFAFAALVPWQLFVRALNEASASLVTDQRLITRIYFPRILLPTAPVVAGLLDFAVVSVLLLILMAYYQVAPGLAIVFLPAFLLLIISTALGMGYWLSAINVEFRDVRYLLPFLSQLLLFVTPVVYPSTLVPEQYRILYGLNPMAGAVEGFRWALLGVDNPSTPLLAVSGVVAGLLFISGYFFFQWRERAFVDAVGSGGR